MNIGTYRKYRERVKGETDREIETDRERERERERERVKGERWRQTEKE